MWIPTWYPPKYPRYGHFPGLEGPTALHLRNVKLAPKQDKYNKRIIQDDVPHSHH